MIYKEFKAKMAVSFPRLPRWLCGGNTNKDRDKKRESLPKVSKIMTKTVSSSTTVKKMKRRGWIGRGGGGGEEEEKMGNVVFPETDDPEWSIGWVEPHGPGFKSEDESGFVVLVPCYKKVIDGSGRNHILNGFFSSSPPPDLRNMEPWLSSMGNL